jgi:hypothetical protein
VFVVDRDARLYAGRKSRTHDRLPPAFPQKGKPDSSCAGRSLIEGQRHVSLPRQRSSRRSELKDCLVPSSSAGHGTLYLTPALQYPVSVRLTTGISCATSGGAPDEFRDRIVRYECANTNMWLLDPMKLGKHVWSYQTALLNHENNEYSPGPTAYVQTAYYS